MRCDRRRAVSSHSASVQHNYTTCREWPACSVIVQYVWGQSLRRICRKSHQIMSTSSLEEQFLCQQLCCWLVLVFYAGFGVDTCSTVFSVSTILFWSVSCASMILLCRVFSASMILLCTVFSPSMILLCAVFSASGIHGARSQIWAQSTWQIWIMRSNVQVNNGYRSWNYHHCHNIEKCRWVMDITGVGNYHHSHNIKCAGE